MNIRNGTIMSNSLDSSEGYTSQVAIFVRIAFKMKLDHNAHMQYKTQCAKE